MSIAGAARRLVVVVGGVLLCVIAAPAAAQEQPPASTAPPPDIANEFRITGFPSYPLTEKLSGFGYVGYVSKPDAAYSSLYLGTGTFYRPHKNIQLWLGLIGVWTDNEAKSNLLELRPFGGVNCA